MLGAFWNLPLLHWQQWTQLCKEIKYKIKNMTHLLKYFTYNCFISTNTVYLRQPSVKGIFCIRYSDKFLHIIDKERMVNN